VDEQRLEYLALRLHITSSICRVDGLQDDIVTMNVILDVNRKSAM